MRFAIFEPSLSRGSLVKPIHFLSPATFVLWLVCAAATAQNLPYKIFGGTEFPGNDLYKVGASTTRDCAAHCLADAQCGAFTFHMPSGTCYLKSGPSRYDGTLTSESGIVERRGVAQPGTPMTGTYPVAPPPILVMPQGRPTSCTANGNDVCSGCSVTCPAGQQASCSDGEVHRTEGFSPVCWTRAKCECR
jgi:hypothetical protein